MTKAELISYLREIDKVFQTEEKAFDAKFNAQRALGHLGNWDTARQCRPKSSRSAQIF